MRSMLPALVAIVALLGGTAVPAAAEHLSGGGGDAPSEGVVTDACRELPEDRDGQGEGSWGAVTGEACDTVRVATWNLADVCWTGLREVGAPGAISGPMCEPLYGQEVSDEHVDAFEGSWVELAHRDQNRWARPLPLRDRTVVATHNSYNSHAYDYAFSRMDANQTYAMRDQLRLGVRRLELDVHWFADTTAPDPAARRPVLCHARSTVPGTVLTEHTGCSLEFGLADGLAEIDAWLDANRDQFVMLRFENHLDGRAGYDAAAADLATVLGDHLFTPPDDGGCHAFDTSLTAAEVLASGAHVFAVSDCGPGTAWRGLVWDDGGVRREATYRAAYRDAFRAGRCPTPWDASADLPGYPGAAWVRFYNDGTWLSASSSRGPDAGPLGGDLPVDATAEDAAAWMACGVNQPAFDFLTPTDGRLEAMVWSWAPEENLDTGDSCAVLGDDGHFHSEACRGFAPADDARDVARGRPFQQGTVPGDRGDRRPFLCRTADGFVVSTAVGLHVDGATVCTVEVGGTFAFPRTARQLAEADVARTTAEVGEVWIDLAWNGDAWAPTVTS